MYQIATAVILCVSMVRPVLSSDDDDLKQPPPKTQQQLRDTVLPALHFGDALAVVEAVVPLVTSSDAGELAAIDRWLVSQGQPELGFLLTQARWQLLIQGRTQGATKPTWQEAVVVAPAIADQLADFSTQLRKQPIFSDPVSGPERFSEYDGLFWNIDSWANRVENNLVLADFGVDLLSRFSPVIQRKRDRLPDDVLAELSLARLEQARRDLLDLQHEFEQRSAELRYYRLEDAVSILRASPQIADRLRAALSFRRDANWLQEFLKASKRRGLSRQNLADPELPQFIESLTADGRQLAGDLLRKAEWLDEGLRWWYRGRYGAGPLANGLLKLPEAALDERAMVALLMPNDRPVPRFGPSASEESIPYYQRRHYYNWAIEQRPIYYQRQWQDISQSSSAVTEDIYDSPIRRRIVTDCGRLYQTTTYDEVGVRTTTTTTTPRFRAFTTRQMGASDPTMLSRLVGTYEYARALSAFEQLVSNSSADELSAYDTIIAGLPEYQLLVNLDGLALFNQAAPLQQPQNNHWRSGLAWLMALARIELVGNVAAYAADPTLHRDIFPLNYDRSAYKQLIVDALRSHLKALSGDALFADLLRRAVFDSDTDTAAYVRRLNLIIALLEQAGNLQDTQTTPHEQMELLSWYETTRYYRDRLHAALPADRQTLVNEIRLDPRTWTRAEKIKENEKSVVRPYRR